MCAHCQTSRDTMLILYRLLFGVQSIPVHGTVLPIFLIDTFTLFWFARRTRIAVQLTASYEKPEHIYVYCNCHLKQLKRTMSTWHSSMHFYANPVFISSLHQWWYHHRKSWHFVFNWIFVFQDFQNRSVWKSFAQKKITRKKIRRENFVENLISLCMLLRMFTC